MSITLSDHQWETVKVAKNWFANAVQNRSQFEHHHMHNSCIANGQAFALTGYAGSGKSTCVGTMIEDIGLSPDEVMFMAPTGKAALVLTRKLREDGWNSLATTIHKAIYIPKAAHADKVKRELDIVWRAIEMAALGEPVDADGSHYLKNKTEHELRVLAETLQMNLANAMDADAPSFSLKSRSEIPSGVKLMVVDEASMVGTVLADDLSSYGIPILAIGDPGQLPPVKDTWGFNLANPDAMLTEIHRQAKNSPIIRLATAARRGEEMKIADYGDDVRVVHRRDDDVTYNLDRDAMILVGTHRKRWAVSKEIRTKLGFTETGPMAGEPLIVCKNSTKTPALVNGSIVKNLTDHGDLIKGQAKFALKIHDDTGIGNLDLTVTQGLYEEHYAKQRNAYSAPSRLAFESKRNSEHTDWAYAITVHKAQGSEWSDVVVHDESAVFRGDASRWLYTGITRASEKLTVVV